jgi:molybdopterin molybdotransferase
VEQVSLGAAAGRVCARDVMAPGDQPRFTSAAMDGWAVSGVHGAYRLVGESRAGALRARWAMARRCAFPPAR